MVLLLEHLKRMHSSFSHHLTGRFINMNECLSRRFQKTAECSLTSEKDCNVFCIPGKGKRGPRGKIVKMIASERKIICAAVKEAALNRSVVNDLYMIDVCEKGKLKISNNKYTNNLSTMFPSNINEFLLFHLE